MLLTITEIENGFYRYMEYHCLTETYYLSDFPTNDGFSKLYPILSFDNNISIIIKDDYYLNMVQFQYSGIELSK